jgi:hypothetical protein
MSREDSARQPLCADIDMHTCPKCSAGELKVIAAILERPVIEKILEHLDLAPKPPPRAAAREPVPHFVR